MNLPYIPYIGIAFLLIGIGSLGAQTPPAQAMQDQTCSHDSEDQAWARKTGLAPKDVQAVRTSLGLSDFLVRGVSGVGFRCSRIESIDATSLKERHQILVAESDGGPCFRLHVMEQTATGFKQIWSLSQTPVRNWAGEVTFLSAQGVCPLAGSPQRPRTHVTPAGQIVLEVPSVRADLSQRTFPPYVYTFGWDGSKYMLATGDNPLVQDPR